MSQLNQRQKTVFNPPPTGMLGLGWDLERNLLRVNPDGTTTIIVGNNEIINNIIANLGVGLAADLPTSGITSGDIYVATDTFEQYYRKDGVSWTITPLEAVQLVTDTSEVSWIVFQYDGAEINQIGGEDDKLRISANDTTNDYLSPKIEATGGISEILNPAANEMLSLKYFSLYQPDGTNPFVYTDNNGVFNIDGNVSQSVEDSSTTGFVAYKITKHYTGTAINQDSIRDLSTLVPSGVGVGFASFDASVGATTEFDFGHIAGFQFRSVLSGSGSVSYMRGFMDSPTFNGSGLLAERHGTYIFDILGTGAVTNNYGIKIDELTRGASNYAIYTSGGTISSFGGNVGFGKSLLEDWNSSFQVIELGSQSCIFSTKNTSSSGSLNIGQNTYIDTDWRHINTGKASSYSQSIGSHIFRVAVSGVADTVVTWDEALIINNDSTITASGAISATDFIQSSDIRLKENIKLIENKGIDTIKLKQFNFKSDKNKRQRYGIIAQELESVHPEMVHADSQGFKTVSYTDYLLAKVDSLEKRLLKLENK